MEGGSRHLAVVDVVGLCYLHPDHHPINTRLTGSLTGGLLACRPSWRAVGATQHAGEPAEGREGGSHSNGPTD